MSLSSGILRVSPSIRLPGRWWLHVECCEELGRYYRWLCLRFTCKFRYMMTPAWGYHITVVRQENVAEAAIRQFEGIEVQFDYDHELKTNEKHFWLDVKSEHLNTIRTELGLSHEPEFPFHITIAVMPGEETTTA